MQRFHLKAFLCPDLTTWEVIYFESLIAGLSESMSIETIRLKKWSALKRQSREVTEKIWLIAADWRKALNLIQGPSEHVWLSSLGEGKALAPSAKRLLFGKGRSPSPTYSLLAHSPFSARFLQEFGGVKTVSTFTNFLPILNVVERPTRGTVNVGTLTPFSADANLGFLVSAAHYLVNRRPEARFVFIGEGPLRSHLIAMVKDLGLERKVSVRPYRTPEDLAFLDVFLYAPLRNYHFLPLCEAARATLPVISTDVPGVEEWIDDSHNGFVIPSEQVKPIAELAIRLVDNTDLRREMGTRFGESNLRRMQAMPLLENYSNFLNPEIYSEKVAA